MSVAKRNSFSRKMEVKSTQELRRIIHSNEYSNHARKAAKWELEIRKEDGTLELENQKRIDLKLGESLYRDFVDTIKKKRQYTFFRTPSYTESLSNNLSVATKKGIALKALEKLKWHLIVNDHNQIQARRPNESDVYTEQIMIGFGPENLLVKSKTLGSQSMDRGHNSIRVKLFLHVFNETMGQLNEERLKLLEKEVIAADNWDDYEIPDTLPECPSYAPERSVLFYLLSALAALIAGVTFGVMTHWFYLIVAFELAIAWVLAHGLALGVRLANYANGAQPKVLLMTTLIIIITAQYTNYFLFINQNLSVTGLDFFNYMQLKIEAGFVLKDLNLGWLGWVGVFIVQALIFYFFTLSNLFIHVMNFVYNRVPEEVTGFAMYHFIKEKTEKEIRNELTLKGWAEPRAQDYVFEAIGAVQGQRDLEKED